MDMTHEKVLGDHYPITYREMFFRAAYHNINHHGRISQNQLSDLRSEDVVGHLP